MSEIFSEYGRKARLFPALLCVFPFLIAKHFIIDPYFEFAFTTKFFAAVLGDISLAIVFIYLLTQINRFISKILFEDLSNFSTTLMLLPSNRDLSDEYRGKINRKIKHDFNLTLPTLEDEEKNTRHAKMRIKEVMGLIINKVGSGKLLLQHNIEYGFARNLIGGSIVALIISLASTLVFSFVLMNITGYIISAILSIIYFIPVAFSCSILKHYSDAYAGILFREYLGK